MIDIGDDIYQALLEGWGGKATPEQVRLAREWLQESPRHKEWHDRLYRLYCKVSYAGNYGRVDVEKAKEKILGILFARRRRRARLRRFLAWSGAAAAVLAVAWFFVHKPAEMVTGDPFEIAEVIGGQADVTLVLANGQEVAVQKDSSFRLTIGAMNVEQASGEGLRYTEARDSLQAESPAVVEYNTVKVPRGGEYMLTLADGTRIWLNSETELKFPVRFVGKTREVEIVGEGYFEVTKDSSRQFIVHAGEMQTRVLGTSFNVKAYADEELREVTLVSGKVRVNANGERTVLSPGWQATWDEFHQQLGRRQVDVKPVISWTTGMFDFVDMPLEKLVAQLGRWYDVDFFFVNESIKGIRFTGAVKRSNTLKYMLDFVAMTSDVRYEVKGKTVCLYSMK